VGYHSSSPKNFVDSGGAASRGRPLLERPYGYGEDEGIECLAKTLSTESTVLVDVNEREETGKLIQKYLLHGYQQMRTKTGDFVFKRGEFSIESGYWDDDDGPFNCRDIYDYDSD